MANPALLHLPLRENLSGTDRNGVVTATASGPVRFTDDGYFAEEGTTNYVSNPRGGNGTTGWSINAGNSALAVDSGVTSEGVPSFRLDITGSDDSAKYLLTESPTGSFAPGDVVTVSFDIRKGAGQSFAPLFAVYVQRTGEAQLIIKSAATISETLDSEFTRITWTSGVLPALTNAVRVYWYLPSPGSSSPVGSKLWIARPQYEKKAYATSYADGAMGTGYSWGGTAHASASTRAASYLKVNPSYLLAEQGSVIVRANPPSQTSLRGLMDTGSSKWRLYLTTSPTGLLFSVGGTSFSSNGHISIGTENNIYAQWDVGELLKTQVNGLSMSESSATLASSDLSTDDFWIGRTQGGAYLNGYISDVLIFDRPLTASERATLAATPAWSFDVLGVPFIANNSLRIGIGLGL